MEIKSIIKNMKIDTPKPNKIYYNSYFAAGFLRYPRRLLNLLKYRLSKFSHNVNYYPMTVDIEPTQRCNYRCIMCIISSKAQNKEDMTFDTFRKIIDEQFGLMEVKIQGVGEPLLNKDFFKMIDYAKRKWLWVRTTINGSLLHVKDNYKKLVDTKVHDINISIDGCTKEVYESIRVGGNFERIKENCKLINGYNNRVKKTTVRAWVVLQRKNKSQFLDFPRFFAELGFREMAFSFAIHNYGRDGNNAEVTEFSYSEEDIKQVIRVSKEVGIKVNYWFHPYFEGKAFCQIPFNRVYITADGHILPCCYIANQEIIDFGAYSDFKKIWFKDYVAFRKNIKDKNPGPPFCKLCNGDGG